MTAFFLFVGKFLKGIPLWVWAAIALGVGFWAYGEFKESAGLREGRAEIQADWDAQKATDKAAAEEENRRNRAKEAANQAAAQAARTQLQQDIADGNQRAETLAADLAAERGKRVRDIWRSGQCDVSSDHAADRAGEGTTNAQAESIGRIDRELSAAEARITFLLARYAEAEKTCGTIPETR